MALLLPSAESGENATRVAKRQDGLVVTNAVALGSDPGEGNASAIRRRLADAESLGEQAVLELAAGATSAGAAELKADLDRVGFDFRPGDGVAAGTSASVPEWGTTEAWRIGVALAEELRERALPNGDPVTNRSLAEMAGAPERALSAADSPSASLSFEWETPRRSRIALRSKWETGRRFDLARLLAERLLRPVGREPLRAVTRSYTYGQKAQRAFAAEFLAPIDAVDAFLSGDYSEERQSGWGLPGSQAAAKEGGRTRPKDGNNASPRMPHWVTMTVPYADGS